MPSRVDRLSLTHTARNEDYMSFQFPKDFIWGTSTSAHQVEGNNVNSDLWHLEHVDPTVFVEPSGDACEQFLLYKTDIEMLAALGFNAYRFSIEWARIEPEPGLFSQNEIDHYRRVLDACRDNNITPIVTLHHFTSPRWLASKGGWESKETPALFANYALKVTEALGDRMVYVCTINELNIAALLSVFGDTFINPASVRAMLDEGARAIGSPSYDTFFFGAANRMEPIVLKAHHEAAAAIRSLEPTLPIGMTVAIQDFQAVDGGEALMESRRHKAQDVYLEEARGGDFIGVQCYTRMCFDSDGMVPPAADAELTQMGYEFWPQCVEASIRHAIEITGCPALVTENGIGTNNDTRRIAYLNEALAGVVRCLEDGLDILGYCQWSLLDNFEWILGYRPTFGIVEVDRITQERTPKPSAAWLGEIARNNVLQAE